MNSQQDGRLYLLFARVFWFMLGPGILFLCVVNIVMSSSGWLTAVDIVFALVVAGMLLARWLEFRAGNPRRSDGQPAQPGDLPKYVIGTTATALVVWIAANLAGNHLM